MSATLAARPDSSVQSISIRNHFNDDIVNGMISRLMLDHEVDADTAERMLNGALTFITLCGENPDGFYAPSIHVDHAWHLLILCTTEYEQLCEDLAGRFIHHTPTFLENEVAELTNIENTVCALEELGLPVDTLVWGNAGEAIRCRSPRPTPSSPSCGGSSCSGSSCGGGGGGE